MSQSSVIVGERIRRARLRQYGPKSKDPDIERGVSLFWPMRDALGFLYVATRGVAMEDVRYAADIEGLDPAAMEAFVKALAKAYGPRGKR